MYRGERVPLHAVTLERGQAPHNPGEAALSALVHPVGVVDLRRAVYRQPHEEAVLGEERGPRIVEEGAVGLDRVHDPLAWLLQRLGQLDW